MKAEIDMEGRLLVQPGTLTEQVALFAWFEGLPTQIREAVKPFLLPCHFDGGALAAQDEQLREFFRRPFDRHFAK
jgi:hypothetical protein